MRFGRPWLVYLPNAVGYKGRKPCNLHCETEKGAPATRVSGLDSTWYMLRQDIPFVDSILRVSKPGAVPAELLGGPHRRSRNG